MSQEKVDRHKEEKRNRAKIIKKEKRNWRMTEGALALVAVVLVAWVGVSAYNMVQSSSEEETTVLETYSVNTTALDNYMSGLDY